MTYKIPYDGNLKWLVPRTIFYCVHGSRAYGTSRPDSDYDYKGVAVPPREYRDGFLNVFEQAIMSAPIDATIFEVRKFFKLAADANPNILELLYVAPEDVLVCTSAGQRLLDNRDLFMSKKVFYTFRGYAVAQLKRIRGHRRWLLEPPTHAPERGEYGLPERTVIPADQIAAATDQVNKQIDSWEVDFGDLEEGSKIHIQEQVSRYMAELGILADEKFAAAGRQIGLTENFLVLLDAEKRYKLAQTEWSQYQTWKSERNEKRAALEAKFGYDTKHGMHLVRLLRMCSEILSEGKCYTRRPDATELLSIRDGAWSYDRMDEWAIEQDKKLEGLLATSKLPKAPDRVKLDKLCQEIVQSMDSTAG